MKEEQDIKTYSISLHFDEESSLFITSLIKDISRVTRNSYRENKAIPPHITVGMFKAIKDKTTFISMCSLILNHIKPFTVDIEKFDALKGKILYASLSDKERFRNIVKGFSDSLSSSFTPCSNNLYTPEFYLPHITLATGLSNKQREEALKVIDNIIIPKKICINKVVLAITKPYEVFFEK